MLRRVQAKLLGLLLSPVDKEQAIHMSPLLWEVRTNKPLSTNKEPTLACPTCSHSLNESLLDPYLPYLQRLKRGNHGSL